MDKEASRHTLSILAGIVFGCGLLWQASEIFRGWDHNILAHHGFRQSQTAISAYYFAKEGFSLYTTIPVFGPPWIIPMEFPLYQWLLAGIVEMTGLPLEQSGRGLSLIFHYLALGLTFGILRHFRTGLAGSFFILTMITLSPLATYWAQGVLIESFSVALTMAFILLALKGFQSNQSTHLIGALIVGSVAAVVKVTTFAVGWGFLVLYALHLLYANRSEISAAGVRSRIVWLLPFLVPLLSAGAWIHHANSVMATLPIAPSAMSNIEWYFGTPGARFEPDQWLRILEHTVIRTLGGPFPLLLALFPLCLQGVPKTRIGLFLLAALSGPLVFWNVYYVHDYYSYEILFFLCVAIGLCFENGLQVARSWIRPALLSLQVLLLLTMLVGYTYTPYAWLFRNDHKADHLRFYEQVADIVPGDNFLLVAGQDWDPSAAYSTRRKTLMIRWNGWADADFFMQAFKDTEDNGYTCGGIIIQADKVPGELRGKILSRFGMNPEPVLRLNNTLLFFEAL